MKPFQASVAYAADLQAAYDYFKQGGQFAADRFLARYTRVRGIITETLSPAAGDRMAGAR